MTQTRHDSSSDREKSILVATLELVASEGLLNTSISKIAKRAQASPGIIYHYFESKNAIMQTLYANVFGEMMAYVMDDRILEMPIEERYSTATIRKKRFSSSSSRIRPTTRRKWLVSPPR
jgi:AcrR family transcriptional regulator